jgi:hypothetical protein
MQLVAAFFQLTKSDWVLEPSLIFVKDKLQMMCQTNHSFPIVSPSTYYSSLVVLGIFP